MHSTSPRNPTQARPSTRLTAGGLPGAQLLAVTMALVVTALQLGAVDLLAHGAGGPTVRTVQLERVVVIFQRVASGATPSSAVTAARDGCTAAPLG